MKHFLSLTLLALTACGGDTPTLPGAPVGATLNFRGSYQLTLTLSAACPDSSTHQWNIQLTQGDVGGGVMVEALSTGERQLYFQLVAPSPVIVTAALRVTEDGKDFSGAGGGTCGVGAAGRSQASGTLSGEMVVSDRSCRAADHRWALTPR